MRVIGHAAGVGLNVPDDAYLSFFNSPYAGHERGTAVDVYPIEQAWGCPVQSPVDGKISHIRKMRMGRPREFETADHDFAIGISVEGDEETLVRLMHCQPSLEEGSSVAKGEEVGKTLRSRYFNYWTGPHYHVEVMRRSDIYRSTRSFSLEVNLGDAEVFRSDSHSVIELEVIRVSHDNALLDGRGLDFAKVGPYRGLLCETSESRCLGLLDAGIPHYPHGALVGNAQTTPSDKITFQSHTLGQLLWSRGSLHYYLRTSLLSFDLDGNAVRGLSGYLYPKDYLIRGVPPLLAIPPEHGGFVGQLEERASYRFNINTVKETRT